MNVQGYVESVTRSEVRGWATDVADPSARLTIELASKNNRIAIARADQVREDLVGLKLGQSSYGFSLEIPTGTVLDLASLEVRIVGSDVVLPGLVTAARYEGVVERAMGTLVTGWAWRSWTPTERPVVLFRINGQLLGKATSERFRVDLLKAGIGDGCYSFEFDIRGLERWQSIDISSIEVVFETTGEPLHDLRTPAPPQRTKPHALYSASGKPLPSASPVPSHSSDQKPSPSAPPVPPLSSDQKPSLSSPVSPELAEAVRGALDLNDNQSLI